MSQASISLSKLPAMNARVYPPQLRMNEDSRSSNTIYDTGILQNSPAAPG